MKISKSIHSLCLLIFFISNSYASTMTWIGGTGDWENPSNWDSGQIPESDDIAVITSGLVTVDFGFVNNIILEGGALHVAGNLIVQPTIANSQGQYHGIDIHQNASFINNGLTVMTQLAPVTGFARFIFNSGEFINNSKGYIYMEGEHFVGMHNYIYSSTTNYGQISMKNIKEGIYSITDVYNHGDINIISNNYSVVAQDMFYNGSGANLITNNRISVNEDAFLNNYGKIDIDFEFTNQGMALGVAGKLISQVNSNISITGSFVDGIYIYADGEMRIKGDLDVSSVSPYSSALYCHGFFVNHQKGNISLSSGVGVTMLSDGSGLNYGTWFITDATNGASRSLEVGGSFNNRPKGKLHIDNKITATPGSTLNNQGHMFIKYANVLDEINGTFNNTACLNDLHGMLSSPVNNSSIIIQPLAVSPEVNVPIPNALNIGANPGTTVLLWYTTETGNTVAGSYNSNTNTFTPNANAVGLSSLFVRTRINAGGVTRRHEVQFDDPVQASIVQSNPSNLIQERFKTSISTYPNPATNNLRISTNENYELGEIKLINISGQLILNKYCDNSKNCDLEFSKDTPNGIYYLYVTDNTGTLQSAEQIKIMR